MLKSSIKLYIKSITCHEKVGFMLGIFWGNLCWKDFFFNILKSYNVIHHISGTKEKLILLSQ